MYLIQSLPLLILWILILELSYVYQFYFYISDKFYYCPTNVVAVFNLTFKTIIIYFIHDPTFKIYQVNELSFYLELVGWLTYIYIADKHMSLQKVCQNKKIKPSKYYKEFGTQ